MIIYSYSMLLYGFSEHIIKDSGPRRMMGYSAEMRLTGEIVNRLEEEELMMEPSMAPMPSSTDQTSISHELEIT